MPNTNLENSKTNMKTRIRNRVQAGQTPRDLGRLAKSARFVGLLDDAEVETDIDTQMTAAIPTASVDDLVEMSEGIKELRGSSADMGQVATTDNLTEGGNKFLKAENVQPAISVSGDLSYDNGVVSYTAPTAAALQVVATVGDLPLDATAGTQAVVTANNKLYIRTADGWYAVALINTAPTVSGNSATYELATDGTPTVITMAATDPENDPVTFSYAVTSGDLNGTTVNQTDNVFTITPHASQAATFELTFSANDTVNVATSSASSFTLGFGLDWHSVDFGVTAHQVGVDGSGQGNYEYLDALASTDDCIIVASTRAYGSGRMFVYDNDFNELSSFNDYSSNRRAATGGLFYGYSDDGYHQNWNQAGELYGIAANGNYVAFKANRTRAQVDVWDISDPSNPAWYMTYTADSVISDSTVRSKTHNYGWGSGLDIRGNYLVIGDKNYDGNKGAVFVIDLSQSFTFGDDMSSALMYMIDADQAGAGASSNAAAFGYGIAIANNGTFAVSASDDNTITGVNQWGGVVRIFNISDGSLVTTLDVTHYTETGEASNPRAPGRGIKQMAISEDGSRLAIGDPTHAYGNNGIKGVVSVFEVSTGNRIFFERADSWVSENSSRFGERLDISPEGDFLIWSAYDNGNNDQGTIFVDSIDNPRTLGGSYFKERGPTQSASGMSGVSAFGSDVHFAKNKVLVVSQVNRTVWYYD